MASSPERPAAEARGDEVRWPLVAKIGVALAVLTVVVGIGAALAAAFVVDRDDGSPVVEENGAEVFPSAV